jgi:hypothetical protein
VASSKTPFNLSILVFQPQWLLMVRPVTSLDIFIAASKNLHPDGLFSSEIFGTPGTDARYSKESYIDVKLEIFHPLIWSCVMAMKSLYIDICSSKAYAKFDDTLKDFVAADAATGQTGYAFFVSKFKDIVFQDTGSDQRREKMDFIAKYKDKALTAQVYVLPAGYRDIEIDETGRVSSNEVNELYGQLIAISNTITPALVKADVRTYDAQRMRLQNAFNDIYKMMFDVIQGKNNLMMAKWAGRAVFNSTRNVLTGMDIVSPELGDPSSPDINNATTGILQFVKATLPKALHHLKTGFLSSCFISASAPATLTDKRTLQSVTVPIKTTTYAKWQSEEGLEKVINSYKERSIRDKPIMIEGHYLGLMYRGNDGTFRVIHGIEELPAGRTKEECTPLTLTELFYTECYEWANSTPILITRYPILSARSIFPAMTYLLSTVKDEKRVPLDENWQAVPNKLAPRFPIKGMDTYDSLSPHPVRLVGLGADFDGDTGSATAVLTQEGQAEVQKLLTDKSFYIGSDGKFVADISNATVEYIMANLTGH